MRDKAPFLIVASLIVLGLLGLFVLGGSDSGRRIDNSPIGLSGLAEWGDAQGLAVRRSHPRLSPNLQDLALRVFAIYDTDLTSVAPDPGTRRDLFVQDTQKDLSLEVYQSKLNELPTVVVLPKWTTGLIETGIAHQVTLIGDAAMNRLLGQIGLGGARIRRAGPEFLTIRETGSDAVLFHAQGIAPASVPSGCRSELQTRKLALLLVCRFDNPHETWIVTDPDLLNNHGLRNGDNADLALTLLRDRLGSDTRDIYLDTSPQLLTAYEQNEDERREYERSVSDLSRYFDYPFNVLWAMLFIVLGVLYWRGARRFGPIAMVGEQGRDISRQAAISAKARLLRLSGNDGQMVTDFVRAQLQDLTQQTFGPDLGEAGQKRFFAHLARSDAALAREFEATARGLIERAATLPRAELSRQLTHYKTLLEKVVNTHGSLRISGNH